MKFTFKSFKGDKKDSEEDPPLNPQAKRKDQIRRAQKTHRERKEAYTKSLEREVVQLRANEAQILQETRRLYAEITTMKRVMAAHGIEVPTIEPNATDQNQPGVAVSLDVTSPNEAFDLSIRVSNNKQKHRHIHVHRHASPGTNQKSTPSDAFDTSHSSEYSELSPALQTNKCVAELDQTAIGMDFILGLEAPCLPHLTSAPLDLPSGHALMASATLLHHHPSPHSHSHSSSSKFDTPTWRVPSTSIERLLALSSTIPLPDDELTPVQAWDQVRRHPGFGSLEVGRLEGLKEALLRGLKCYGFGGVIEQGAFQNAVFEAFVVGRVF